MSLESVFQMGFNVIDQVIVGLLGADAVAAVGLSNSMASIALLLYASAGVGAGVMVARAFGRKDMNEVSRITAAGQLLAGGLGLFTAVLLIAFSNPLLQLVAADPKLAQSADIYFRLYSASIAPMILSAIASAVFRSLNAPRIPLVITSAAVALNTALGFILVLGFGPIPSFGVAGAGFATLISQTVRCLTLITWLYTRKKGVRWVWPLPGSKVAVSALKLARLTGPIAASEVLWGVSTFVYAIVFTRLGTTALAASQIVLSLESMFIVASAGLGPAAVAVIGHALGVGSLKAAKANAWIVIRFGLLAAITLGLLYAASGLLLPTLYPKVGRNVLGLAFWGVLLMAATQPAKVLSSVLGNGVLASGSDTRFLLFGNLMGTYLVGLPAAIGLGLIAPFGFFGVFAAKVSEEVVKAGCFFLRFCGARWYASALKEEAKEETEGTAKLV
ncbi:MAG: MATE family efflux transporter [Verrucomicrobia bacterium]|nr:MATE family efflux transporter [Verrucomicrobiota bacterium]